MRSMILWPVTGTGGWVERQPVVCRLKQNVSDLSDHEERQVRQWACDVVSSRSYDAQDSC